MKNRTDKGFRNWTLATKLRPPSMGVRHLPRPRLSAGGPAAGRFRLALVSAPAGSGKTTVLSEWYQDLRKKRRGAAWLSLDSFDNEPRRFLVQLISAVQSVQPGFGEKASRLLTINPDTLLEDLAESLVHDFGGDFRTVIFLDDYHAIRDRAIHAMVDYLLRYAPENIRFVIGTRKTPPLSVERFRLRGEVLELGWDDLRFNIEEARNYLTEICRLPLSEEQVQTLCDRTEGWVTGLQLASMAFAGTSDPSGLVAGFTGEHRNIADYLLEDVFRRQSASMRQFLMKTSILDRMTASLCDAITGRQDSRQWIEALERGNLFIFGLDEHRTWYRYHHLFAEFLQNRLKTEHQGDIAELHDRASEWFEKNGHSTEAVRYAVAGKRFPRAARLLETAGRELFRQGDFKELRRWIDALPESAKRRSPILCTLHAWALAYMGEFEYARECIDSAARIAAKTGKANGRVSTSSIGPIRAELQVLRAVIGIIQTDEPDVAGLHSGIVSLFPRKESALRGYAYITLGFASRVEGYLSLALQHFRNALVVSDGSNSSLVNLNARLNIGIVNYVMGRANDAEESFRKSLEVSRERLWLRSIGAAFLRYGLALVLYDRNRLEEALAELSDTIAFLEAGDAFGFLGMALVERARVQHALGRNDLAGADIARAREVARKHHVGRVSFRADLLETRMAVLAGKTDRAAEFLDAAKAAFDDESIGDRPVYPEKYEYFVMERIRLLSARGRHEEAVEAADKAASSAESAGRGRNLIEFLILKAAALNGLSKTEKAQETLEQALSLAAGERILRPFLNSGERIAPMLRQLKAREKFRGTISDILSSLEDGGGKVAGDAEKGRTSEPFHQREVQILKLVSEGLRNRDIGRRLFLSEETVKWYLKGLYCKLDVGTRTEAIAKARKLGIIAEIS
jgi:LuxR family maltose regulon positive regulatory protein